MKRAKRAASSLLENIPASPTVFGRTIRGLRETKRFSQAQLARQAGLAQAHLSHIERGARIPSPAMIEKMAGPGALGLTRAITNQLLSAATVLRESPAQPALPKLVSPENERDRQAGASEVWVIANEPLELRDPNYLDVVLDGLAESTPRRYVYWTAVPSNFYAVVGKIHDGLVQRASRPLAPAVDLTRPLEAVAGIQTPSTATWFSFVIYNPRDPYTIEAYMTLERDSMPAGRLVDLRATSTLRQAHPLLVKVFDALDKYKNKPYKHEETGTWKRLPEEETAS